MGGPVFPVYVVHLCTTLALPILAYNGCDLHLFHSNLPDTSGKLQLVLGTVRGMQRPPNIRLSTGYSNPRMELIQCDCGAGQALSYDN